METFALTLFAFAALLAAVYFFHSREHIREDSNVVINNYASQNHLLLTENRSLKEQLDELGEAGATLLLIDLYVPHRGYLGKDGEPEYENDNHYTDHKIEDHGRGFRFVGNIHKDPAVLIDPQEDEKRN